MNEECSDNTSDSSVQPPITHPPLLTLSSLGPAREETTLISIPGSVNKVQIDSEGGISPKSQDSFPGRSTKLFNHGVVNSGQRVVQHPQNTLSSPIILVGSLNITDLEETPNNQNVYHLESYYNPSCDYSFTFCGLNSGFCFRTLFHFLNRANTWPRLSYQFLIIGLIATSLILSVLTTLPSFGSASFFLINIFEVILFVVLLVEYFLLCVLCTSIPEYRLNRLEYVLSYPRLVDAFILIVSLAIVLLHTFYINSTSGFASVIMLNYVRLVRLEKFIKSLPLLYNVIKKNSGPFLGIVYITIMEIILFAILMYYAERAVNPEIETMPQALYWSVITLTTVGYGDVTPETSLGKAIATVTAIFGFYSFCLPAGLIGTAIALHTQARRKQRDSKKAEREYAARVIQSFYKYWALVNKTSGTDIPRNKVKLINTLRRFEHDLYKFASWREKKAIQNDSETTVYLINKKLDKLLTRENEIYGSRKTELRSEKRSAVSLNIMRNRSRSRSRSCSRSRSLSQSGNFSSDETLLKNHL